MSLAFYRAHPERVREPRATHHPELLLQRRGQVQLEGTEHAGRQGDHEYREDRDHPRRGKRGPERLPGERGEHAQDGVRDRDACDIRSRERHRACTVLRLPGAEHADGDGDERVDARREAGQHAGEEEQGEGDRTDAAGEPEPA